MARWTSAAERVANRKALEEKRQKEKATEQPIHGKCVECRKARTVCIHLRRRVNMGHVSITLGDGTNFTAYGNWPVPMRYTGKGWGAQEPERDSVDRHSSEDPASTRNNPERDKNYDARNRKCKELKPEEEKKLREYLNNPSTYALRNNNCLTWANGAWQAAGGSSFYLGSQVHLPRHMGL